MARSWTNYWTTRRRIPVSDDTAAVLAELVAAWREVQEEGWSLDRDICWDRAMGNAYTVVDALATSGARAGGENPWTAQSEDLLPCVDDEAATEAKVTGGESAADVLMRLRAESPRHLTREELPEHYAAPPTPAAPGVAELLAECRERQGSMIIEACIPVGEIVRLLAPGGVDGEGT